MTGIYSRVSTQEQAQNGHSIDEQVSRMTKYCEALGWSFSVYTDAGYSGSNTNRPALQRLIEDAKTGKIERVLVYKLDRLSRSQKDTLTLIDDVFLANGCDFVSISENFDTATPLGRAMIGILAVFAQLEREQIRERMSMGKEARIRQGKWTGGISPYGYTYKKKTDYLTVDPQEAPYVKMLFEAVASGKPIFRVMEDFNAAGYRLRNNNWSMWSIKYMLENKTYCGYIRHNDEWLKGNHEAIITEELFDRVASILSDNRRKYEEQGIPSGGRNVSTLLGGLIRCGICGGKYGKRLSGSPPNRHYTYVCYSRCKKIRTMIKDSSCKNKIYRVEDLDKIILNEIRKLRIEPIEDEKKLHLSQAELDDIELRISRLVDLYASGRLSYNQLDGKIADLEKKRDSMLRERQSRVSVNMAQKTLENLDDILDSGDFNSIRSLIETLIDRIVITGDDIDIYWSFR
jgi:site-specific DNA recombinase